MVLFERKKLKWLHIVCPNYLLFKYTFQRWNKQVQASLACVLTILHGSPLSMFIRGLFLQYFLLNFPVCHVLHFSAKMDSFLYLWAESESRLSKTFPQPSHDRLGFVFMCFLNVVLNLHLYLQILQCNQQSSWESALGWLKEHPSFSLQNPLFHHLHLLLSLTSSTSSSMTARSAFLVLARNVVTMSRGTPLLSNCPRTIFASMLSSKSPLLRLSISEKTSSNMFWT